LNCRNKGQRHKIYQTIAFGLLVSLLSACQAMPPKVNAANLSMKEAIAPILERLRYETVETDAQIIHILTIPTQRYTVVPVVSDQLQPLDAFVQQTGALAALNAGFFDPINQKTTSTIVVQGQVVADPRDNERLMENPDLTNYLDQILNRSEFRRLRCGSTEQYGIAQRQDPPATDCTLLDAIAAGPQLLPDLTSEAEGFVDRVDGQIIRDALGSTRRNARTAVGLMATGDVVWVMVAQRSPDGGMTLEELANFMRSRGIVTALNLDGGSSSALAYGDILINGRFSQAAMSSSRPVKSALIVVEK
jgi:hypothetical protein